MIRSSDAWLGPFILAAALLLALGAGCRDSNESGSGNAGGRIQQQRSSETADSDKVYQRIIKSGTIRAAYITYPPALMKDTKTGQMSGIFVEVIEKVAENLDLKVEWTEEVGWASQIEGLEADRYDIIGSPVWANPTRGKLTLMSVPVYYSGIDVYVRADEERFTMRSNGQAVFDPTKVNQAKVRIATIDGETGDLIARTDFPKAKRVSLPQLTDISQLFLEVASGKADLLFAEPYYGHEYLKNNPGSVKNIASAQPVRVFGNCYMFRQGEPQLKHMLDVAIEDLQNSGFVDNVIRKYEPAPGTFYRVARPFRLAE